MRRGRGALGRNVEESGEAETSAGEPGVNHQILLAGGLPVPLGAREMEVTPQIGEMLTAEIDGVERHIEVLAVQHLPVIAGGTFAHDEAWVICRLA
jgi:hypothetical protein